MNLSRLNAFCIFNAGMLLSLIPLAYAAPRYASDSLENIERVRFTAKKGDWDNAKNWDSKKVPEGFVRVYVEGICTLSSRCSNTDDIMVSSNPKKSPAILYIEEGTVAKLAGIGAPHLLTPNAAGEIYMRGGKVETGNGIIYPGTVHLGVGGTVSGTGFFEISGGKLSSGIFVGSMLPNTQTGTFSVVGGRADITANSAGKGLNKLYVAASGTVKFLPDDSGISTLDYSGALAVFEGGKVLIDGSAYKKGSAEFTLLVADSIKGDPKVEIVNFASNYTVDVQKSKESKKRGAKESLVLKIKDKGN